MKKKCNRCNEVLDINNFSMRTRKRNNGEAYRSYLTICKKCNSEKAKEYHRKKKKHNLYFVYRLLGADNEVLYVGKTSDLKRRINSHLSNSHLPEECINDIAKVEYILMKSSAMMYIKEIYYINLYKPIYNELLVANEPIFIIKDFANDKWTTYTGDTEDFKREYYCDSLEAKYITSIFKRKRDNKYYVYIEYLEGNTKKQKLKGSFYDKEEADNLVKELKILYNYKI